METRKMATQSGYNYARSHPGLLKLGQFAFLLAAFVVMAHYNSFYEKHHDPVNRVERTGRFTFFYAVTIMLWIFVIIVFVLCLSGLSTKITESWDLLMILIDILAATLLLVASSLITDEITNLQHFEAQSSGSVTEVNICEKMDKQSNKPKCGHLRGAAACGFLAMLLFIGDIVVHYMRMRYPQVFSPAQGQQPAPSALSASEVEMPEVRT